MLVVAAMLDSRAALVSLRRTLAPGPPGVVACRSAGALTRAYQERLLDAVIVGRKVLKDMDVAALRSRYPGVPVIVFGAFRPDDGDLLAQLDRGRSVTAIAVEGVDDPVIGELVRRHSVSQQRALMLRETPKLLRLTEAIQRGAWDRLITMAGRAVTTGEVAGAMGISREHLSRQFGAGGAPNLKRVIDLLRIVCAAELLANPGYQVATAAAILGFATPSRLNAMSRRITGVPAVGLGGLGAKGVVGAFLRAGRRSRG